MKFEINEKANIKAKLGSIIVTNSDVYLLTYVIKDYVLISLKDSTQYGMGDNIKDLLAQIKTRYNEDIKRIISSENIVLKEEI